jgi:acetyltransferase-like isoleucine patch superfamily enzyme
MDGKSNFYYFGKNVQLGQGINVLYPQKIYVGNNVALSNNVFLSIHSNGNLSEQLRIKLMDRSYIGTNSIIESINRIIVEEDVLIGPNVYISDSQHEYLDVTIPPFYQGFKSLNNTLTIKRGAWIGHSVTIIGNITIGYGSVIGANSMVNFDVPSHCVIVANPARIHKIYHYKQNKWVYPKTEDELLKVLEERGTFTGYDDREILKKLNIEVSNIKSNK